MTPTHFCHSLSKWKLDNVLTRYYISDMKKRDITPEIPQKQGLEALAQAFAALISDCEAAERQAPAEHKELYSMLNDEAQQGRAIHMTDHPTATEAEKDAIQELYGAFSARQAVEEYRRLIQSYVGS